MIEPTAPARVQLVSLDKDGRPAGEPVDVEGIVSVQFGVDEPPAPAVPSLRAMLTGEQRAAVDRAVAAVQPIVVQVGAQVVEAMKALVPVVQAAADNLRAFAAQAEAAGFAAPGGPRQKRRGPRQERRGVTAQRSPYGPPPRRGR